MYFIQKVSKTKKGNKINFLNSFILNMWNDNGGILSQILAEIKNIV